MKWIKVLSNTRGVSKVLSTKLTKHNGCECGSPNNEHCWQTAQRLWMWLVYRHLTHNK